MPKPNANIERPGHPGHQPDVHIHIHGGDIAAAIDNLSVNLSKWLAIIAAGSSPDDPVLKDLADKLKASSDNLQAAIDEQTAK